MNAVHRLEHGGHRIFPKGSHNLARRCPMKVKDPVCGMEFEAEKAVAQVQHQGKTYYFCTEACRKQFEADPAKYVHRS
ncbi:MAG: hypothetical protein KatS3mg081_2943 [Gemmatimonadales bacterium]|nr:MAG: hypothetical protein KatS3mg081_2943 [Gemmatimonadales bacterium]